MTKTQYASNHIPMQRRVIPISHVYEKENIYSISDKDYFDILETIKHTGSTCERTPSTYKSLHEEDLRNVLLASLNSAYKGNANGEAFRNKGKTDISIEMENRAAFVAECKMWTGQKEVAEAVKQLDSYLTWRDCKTALIYFVRKKNFMNIVSTMENTLNGIECIAQVRSIDCNEFKCVVKSKSNDGQLIDVRVFLFSLYAG